MNKLAVFISLLVIAFGIFMVVYGERDDSPGGQLLGVAMFVLGAVSIVKQRRKRLP